MKRVRKKADGKNTTSYMSTTKETPRKVTSRLETMYLGSTGGASG